MSASKKPSVFITRGIPLEGLDRLNQHCEVTQHKGEEPMETEAFRRAVVGMDGLYIFPTSPIDVAALDAAGPQLKVVATHSVGLDHVDMPECKKRGVKVGYTPGVLTQAVAEMTVGITLATARRFKSAMESVHKGLWGTRWENALWMTGKQISGSVVGIVGLGRIGQAVASRLKAFEPSRLVYCGNGAKPEAASIGAEFLSFEELLDVSDFVIATCSFKASMKHLFDSKAFSRMKPTAIFVNVTRGALVDQEALYKALTSGQIAAAGLDVTTPEPLPTDHKLLGLPNCLVIPHLGSSTVKTRKAMCHLTVDNILAGLEGRNLPSPAY